MRLASLLKTLLPKLPRLPLPAPPSTAASRPSSQAGGDRFDGATRDASAFSRYLIDQGRTSSCGTATAAMIANFWRQNPSAHRFEDLDRAFRPVGAIGTTPQNVADWFNASGFRAAAVNNASLETLTALVDKGVPVQVLYDQTGDSDAKGHFVNVIGVSRDAAGRVSSLRIADPQGGRITEVPAGEFSRRWDDVRYLGQCSGYNNAMVVALPRGNTTVRGADGVVRNTADIALPRAGGFGSRATLFDGATDGINLIGRLVGLFRRARPT